MFTNNTPLRERPFDFYGVGGQEDSKNKIRGPHFAEKIIKVNATVCFVKENNRRTNGPVTHT